MTTTRSQRRQRGSIRPRGSGFQVRVYAGRDPLTKKDIVLYDQAPDRPGAEKARTRLLNQVDEQRHPKHKATVSTVLDRWLDVAGPELEESSLERTEGLIRNYLRPTFGDLTASKLNEEMVELFYARLRRCRDQCGGRRNGKKDPATGRTHTCRPLAASSVRKLHFVLLPVFTRAQRWGYVTSNPLTLVDPPSQPSADPDPPSPQEAALVLNTAWQRDLDWGSFLFLTMVTGARRGEMCALRWSDIDFDRRFLWVSTANYRRRIKDTKTHQRRKVTFDELTRDVLLALRERAEARCRALGGTLAADAFVFSLEADYSVPLLPPSVSQRYKRLAVTLELRNAQLKGLRTYNVTELLTGGADLRTVAGRVGHGNGGATTLRHYAAYSAASDRRAAAILTRHLPVPEALVGSRQLGTVVNGQRLACPCGNETEWTTLRVTDADIDALCARCDTPVQALPDTAPAALPEPPTPTPAPWQTISAELRTAIDDGTLPPGSSMPTVAEIATAHGVSVSTAHRAVAHIAAEGLIEVSRGRRAIVRTEEPAPIAPTRTSQATQAPSPRSSDVA